MCDQHRAPVRNHPAELSIYLVLGVGVKRDGRLVKNENLPAVIAGSRDCDTLFLAAGRLYSLRIERFPYLSIRALFKPVYQRLYV